MVNEEFIRYRIEELRFQRQIPKGKMSRDLGHGRNYIYKITSCKAAISVSDLICICEYFGITMSEFFDENPNHTGLIQTVADELEDMDDDDILLMLRLIRRTKR